MSKRIQLRRGTTAEANAFTGAVGEVTVDTDKDTVVVHDGTTVGGHPVASRANDDGTISLIKKDGTSAGIINSAGLFNNTLTSTNTNQALTADAGRRISNRVSYALGAGNGNISADYSGTRVLNTVYTVQKVTFITINATLNTVGAYLTATSSGAVAMSNTANSTTGRVTMSFIILGGGQYSVTVSAGTATMNVWSEFSGIDTL